MCYKLMVVIVIRVVPIYCILAVFHFTRNLYNLGGGFFFFVFPFGWKMKLICLSAWGWKNRLSLSRHVTGPGGVGWVR